MFSPKTSTYTYIAILANLAKFFARSKKAFRIGKKRNFLLWKNFFFGLFPWTSFAVSPTLKMFSAIVPQISKTIHKSSRFQDLLSEMLLCNWSSGHVESSFDNPAKKIPVKIHVFLVKVQKRRKTVCSTVIFSTFFLCTLRLCFETPDYFFLSKSKKNSLKVLKRW